MAIASKRAVWSEARGAHRWIESTTTTAASGGTAASASRHEMARELVASGFFGMRRTFAVDELVRAKSAATSCMLISASSQYARPWSLAAIRAASSAASVDLPAPWRPPTRTVRPSTTPSSASESAPPNATGTSGAAPSMASTTTPLGTSCSMRSHALEPQTQTPPDAGGLRRPQSRQRRGGRAMTTMTTTTEAESC